MWEAIHANQRRSWVLVSLMGAVLVALGFFAGMAFDPRQGGFFGVAAALGLWFLLWMTALVGGDQILLATAGARKVEPEEAPQLHNVVDEMVIASGLGSKPDVYVIHDEAPNAFAIGRKPEKSAVAVTSGLLRLLNRDELQGVVAHEIGHVRNRDVAFMVLVGVMLGAIVLVADVFLRSARWGPRRRSSRGDGQAQMIFFLVALAFAILAPIVAQLIYFACSRRREYLADASAARFTRYPEGLASALEKLAVYQTRRAEVNRVLAPMYIVNPMSALAAVGLYSTHPPTEDRVRVLRSMGGGVGYADYEAAFRRIVGGACIGRRTLSEDTSAAKRGPSDAGESPREAVDRSRDVFQFLGRLENHIVMACACGVGIKVPPGFGRASIPCPRCGRENAVPRAEEEPSPRPEKAFKYRRRDSGWESFQCPCGHGIQLSPSFGAPVVRCPRCDRKIQVLS
jgi:heat shock protein HtpX